MTAVLPPDPLCRLRKDLGHIHCLCFPENERNYTSQVVASTENGFVYFWDLEVNRIRHKQQMGTSIQAIHFVKDNMITQEKSGLVKLWSPDLMSNFESTKSYQCYGGYCKSIVLDDSLIVPQENSMLDVIDIPTMQKTRSLNPSRENLGHCMCLQKFTLNEKVYVMGGYETGHMILWDYQTGDVRSSIKLHDWLTGLTFDPISCRGVASSASNILQVFNIDKTQLTVSLKCQLTVTTKGCNFVKIRPDAKILVAGGFDGRLRVYSWKTLRLLVVLNGHGGALTDVQWSPRVVRFWESNVMAVSSSDGLISLWSIYN